MHLGSLPSSSSGYSVASLISHPPTSYFDPLLSKVPSHQQSKFSKEILHATKDLLNSTSINNFKVLCGSPILKTKIKTLPILLFCFPLRQNFLTCAQCSSLSCLSQFNLMQCNLCSPTSQKMFVAFLIY